MRLIPLFAALALVAATPAAAHQSAPAPLGVAPAAASDWLKSVGATVGEAQEAAGRRYLPVNDGRLDWTLWFYTCDGAADAQLCDDIQYSAIFTGPSITAEKVNDWNRDNRFIKAFYIAPTTDAPARAVAQYDVLLTATGADQMNDVTATWVSQLAKFAGAMGLAAPTPAPAQ